MNLKTAAAALVALISMAAPVAAQGIDVWWYGDEAPGTIVIETSERRLTLVTAEGEGIQWPIAVGREGAQWFGETQVVRKAKNPTWYPTPNMRAKDPTLPVSVGPGPANPLGIRAIYLAEGLLRIHGTNAPRSIGKAASSGCFRMLNTDISELYELADVGSRVLVLD